jgi:hypothetical protein
MVIATWDIFRMEVTDMVVGLAAAAVSKPTVA